MILSWHAGQGEDDQPARWKVHAIRAVDGMLVSWRMRPAKPRSFAELVRIEEEKAGRLKKRRAGR